MTKGHIINKAIAMQAKGRGAAGGSRQLPADPFGKLYGEYGLVKPPYSFDKLMELKESNPIHCACIEAKADDIAGMGWQWVSEDEDKQPDTGKKKALEELLKNCNPEMTFREILRAMWEDFETIGWGILEVVPDGKGQMAELYHVPAYTVRVHNDGVRYAQYRDGVVRWFKRYGDEDTYDMHSGDKKDGIPEEEQAGQLIVIRKAGGRSSYYGIPAYISGLGAIVGAMAVRDFNINWFSQGTIPDTLLIAEGADVDPQVTATLQSFFSYETKQTRGKLAILPVPAETEGVKVRLERLTPETKDASHRLYRQDNNLEICIAHRVPPYRIGWPVTGGLGGAMSDEMNEFYKASVVGPAQEILEHRLNSVLFAPFELGGWKWKLNEMDLSDAVADLDYAVKGVGNRLMTPDEGRKRIGLGPYEDKEEGKKYFQPSTWVEVGKEEPEPAPQPGAKEPIPPEKAPAPPQGNGNKQQGQTPDPDPKKGAQANVGGGNEPVAKADDAGDEYWSDWVKVHHKQEAKTQPIIEDFFDDRRSE